MRFTIIIIFLLAIGSVRAADSTRYYFVFLDPNPVRPKLGLDTIESFQSAHLVAMDRLYRENKLALTGPFMDTTGGEIFIINASTPQEVRTILEADPLVRAHRFSIGISAFEVIAGSICKPPELYDLAKYPFARLKQSRECTEEQRSNQLAYYQGLAREKKILFAARMLTDRSIVIVFAQNQLLAPAQQHLKNDPLVRDGAMKFTLRPWMTSAGVFCDITQ